MATGENLFPHHLFGNYVVEIAKLFKFQFREFQLTPQSEKLELQVYYGTPRAAFRYWYKRFNGQLILPLLNFYGADFRRRYDKEHPDVFRNFSIKSSMDHNDGTVSVTKAPMHFDVTYQFSIYNNSARERDKLLHKIMQLFPRGQRSIRWYVDPDGHPEIFLFMPLSVDESFADETEIEGLDQTETRNIVKTNFTIVSSAVVPYDIYRVPAVTRVLVDNIIHEDEGRYTSLSVSNIIDNDAYNYIFYSSGYRMKFNGACFYGSNYYFTSQDGSIKIK